MFGNDGKRRGDDTDTCFLLSTTLFNTHSLDQRTGSWLGVVRLSTPSIRFDMFPNLVRWTIPKRPPPQFRRDGEFYFFECEVHGDGSDIAVTDMMR